MLHQFHYEDNIIVSSSMSNSNRIKSKQRPMLLRPKPQTNPSRPSSSSGISSSSSSSSSRYAGIQPKVNSKRKQTLKRNNCFRSEESKRQNKKNIQQSRNRSSLARRTPTKSSSTKRSGSQVLLCNNLLFSQRMKPAGSFANASEYRKATNERMQRPSTADGAYASTVVNQNRRRKLSTSGKSSSPFSSSSMPSPTLSSKRIISSTANRQKVLIRQPPPGARKQIPKKHNIKHQRHQQGKRKETSLYLIEIIAAKKIQNWYQRRKLKGNQNLSSFKFKNETQSPEEEEEEEEEGHCKYEEEKGREDMIRTEENHIETKEEEKEEFELNWSTRTYNYQYLNINQISKPNTNPNPNPNKMKQKKQQQRQQRRLQETLNNFPKFDDDIYDPLENNRNYSDSEDDEELNTYQHGNKYTPREGITLNNEYSIQRKQGIKWKDHSFNNNNNKNGNMRSKNRNNYSCQHQRDELCSFVYFSKYESVNMLKNTLPANRKSVPRRGILAVKSTEELKQRTVGKSGVKTGPDDEGDYPRNSIVGKNTSINAGHWRSLEQVQLEWIFEYGDI